MVIGEYLQRQRHFFALPGKSQRTFTPSEKTHGLTESQRKFELPATSLTGLLLKCLFRISKPIYFSHSWNSDQTNKTAMGNNCSNRKLMLLGPSGLSPSLIKEKYLNNFTATWQEKTSSSPSSLSSVLAQMYFMGHGSGTTSSQKQ